MSIDTAECTGSDPFRTTLVGEYIRVLLSVTAVATVACWSPSAMQGPVALWLVVANLAVLATCIDLGPCGLLRMLGLVTLAVAASLRFSTEDVPWWGPIWFMSPGSTLVSLGVLAARDLLAMLSRRGRDGNGRQDSGESIGINQMSEKSSEDGGRTSAWSYRRIAIVLACIGMTIYMIIVPSGSAVMESFAERPTSYALEDLTVLELLRVRTAKLAVFLVFASFGACLGSFLNVVAASLPRGDSIALRSSACPQCHTPIRRIDNLPIFSYLNLGGRCRHCQAAIPVRYLAVEVLAMLIVSLLFFCELITGAANVPGFPFYQFTGIVWIILYTKWPVVGIFFFHVAMMCMVMTVALMERDRLRPPVWFAITLWAFFALLPVLVPTLRPIDFGRHLPSILQLTIPEVADRAVSSLLGGSVGWLMALLADRIVKVSRKRGLVTAFVLVGIAMGWQAVVTITVIYWLMVWALSLRSFGRRWMFRNGATAVLLAAVVLHHPFWKMIDRCW
ncbi:A24 family peptidase [Crateriforma conspicua]|uniref:Leader peptidase PppA n=1 Tax=Crateriforma conspicua TaxID=2527996 RepID=A0A5C5Y6N4_9PLAN|nr:A24 family peptidase [Crateriforma conspicua]QDV65171.1 Leader peptidase PppA [Crateriforma conspicua]TWT70568.1 Leader peptidase PppA [Crateriforma conspicua]